jgi:tRNA-specific 2-thiouridylase
VARVLVAMSGGVDSSVAAALLAEQGHEVVGATMKLWGGPSDSGCCAVSDVEDARRVADQLGLTHRVFNFSEDFEARVVAPYVADHAAGRTPNPCIECNRHLKFDRFLERAIRLGFDAVATGHHARAVPSGGRVRLLRGADRAKDQSYVLSMLSQRQLGRTLLPVGQLTKKEVRARAAELGLRTAAKPDSQDVCFVPRTPAGPVAPAGCARPAGRAASGRAGFLAERIELHPARVVEHSSGEVLDEIPAVELVTVGQRRGLGARAGRRRLYALEVDAASRTVRVGAAADLTVRSLRLRGLSWVDRPLAPGHPVEVQSSAHGRTAAGVYEPGAVLLREPLRRVAPGQTVALYEGDNVLGSGTAC